METLIEYKYKFLISKSPDEFTKGYTQKDFLIDNRHALQHEYDDLKRVYDKGMLSSPKMEGWFVEVCDMLESYHSKNETKAREYKKQALVIKRKQLGKEKKSLPLPSDTKETNVLELVTQAENLIKLSVKETLTAEDIKRLEKKSENWNEKVSFEKANKIVSTLHMERLHTRFAIITASVALQYARLVGWLEFISQKPVDTSLLEAPIGAYNILSVGLFVVRMLINLMDVLITTAKEEQSQWKRFCAEMEQHEGQFWNDGIWSVVNFFTNFPKYLPIIAPVANQVVGAFLVFDMGLLGYLLFKERTRYSKQRTDNESLLMKLKEKHPDIHDEVNDDIYHQLQQLGYRYENLKWTFCFYIAAGLLLLTGFAAAILLSPPAFVPLCFLACNVAIAMYLSGGLAGDAMEARMICTNEQDNKKAAENFDEALSKLGWAMLEYTFVPVIIMTVFTISWPAAVVLTVAYLAVKCGAVKEAEKEIKNATDKIKLPKFFNSQSVDETKKGVELDTIGDVRSPMIAGG